MLKNEVEYWRQYVPSLDEKRWYLCFNQYGAHHRQDKPALIIERGSRYYFRNGIFVHFKFGK